MNLSHATLLLSSIAQKPNRKNRRKAARQRNRQAAYLHAPNVERLEERVVMAAYTLFDFAKSTAPTVSNLTRDVYADGDSQPWAQGQGGSTVTYVTEQPVTFRPHSFSEVLSPARLYAPAGASYNRLDNKLLVDNNPLYLLPNMSDEDMAKVAVELRDGTRSAIIRVPPTSGPYDPYTDLKINGNTLPIPVSKLVSRLLPSKPVNSNRQILDLNVLPTNRVDLYWNGSTSAEITKDATAEEIETALNNLPSIRNPGGFVTVTAADSAEGFDADTEKLKFVVTFGGGVWFDPAPIQYSISKPEVNEKFSRPAKALLLSTQNTVAIDLAANTQTIPNGFASPLYNVESFVPTEVGASTTYYNTNRNDKTIGTRTLKGLIETSAIAGQFRTTSSFNAIESVLGYRVIDINIEYQLQPVIDPNGIPQPITAFKLNGLNFELKPGTQFVLKSFDKAQTQLYFDTKNDSVEASAEFEGGTLTIRIDKGDNQPALRVDLRKGTVETTRFVSFVSAEIGGVKFTANDGVSFGTDTINQQFRIELQNFTTKPEESSGAAASSIYENLTQVFTPQSDRGVFVAQVYGDQVTDEVFKLAQKKSVSLGPFSGSSQNRGGNWYQPTSRTLVV